MVIVVDDDFQVREALESLLRSAEFSVVTYSSADSALTSPFLAEASCLITDIRMPGMPGLELQRLIKHEHPELPAIIITGHDDEQTRQSALSGGATAVLYKPIDSDELLRALHSAIARPKKDT
jgi:FixJ family two-component response regulator